MHTTTPAHLQAINTLYGHKMLVDPSNAMGREAIRKGVYDYPSIDLLRNILSVQRCRTVLDIGANIGNHALAFSQLCARLLAFEPSEQAYEVLKRNINNNNLRNIRALNFGLSNTAHPMPAETPEVSEVSEVSETAETAEPLERSEAAEASAASEKAETAETAKVAELKIGDAYLKSQLISDVDFIKIGAQGREQCIFEGLKATLRLSRPLVLLEWDGQDNNRSWVTDKEAIQSLFPNYQIFALVWNSNQHYWASKRFGALRRNLIRIFTRKHKRLAKFDPLGHRTQVSDLLLVPSEKLPSVSQYVYR